MFIIVQCCLLELALGLFTGGLCSLKCRSLPMPVQIVCLITTISLDFFICLKCWLVESTGFLIMERPDNQKFNGKRGS